jgi:hypothetical protein
MIPNLLPPVSSFTPDNEGRASFSVQFRHEDEEWIVKCIRKNLPRDSAIDLVVTTGDIRPLKIELTSAQCPTNILESFHKNSGQFLPQQS